MYKNLIKYIFLFHFGGGTYTTIELLFRNETYIQMYVLGGICFLICGFINKFFSWNFGLFWQVLIGTSAVTILEFLTGVIFNIYLNMNMWDYSNMPLNIYGQICPQFVLAWIPIVFLAILLDDIIRWRFFDEEKPKYKIF